MGKFRKSEELLYWRFFLLLYLAGFAAGILFVNLAWRYRTGDLETLTLFTLQGSGTLRMEGYLWYLTKKRGGTLLVLHALGITVLGKLAIAAGLLWSGFLGGTLAAIAVLQLGAKGLAVLTAAGAADFCVSPGRAFLSYCRLADVCPQLGGGKACRGNLPGLSYDFRSRTGSDFLRDSSGMLCEPSCAGGGPGNLRKSYKKFTNKILTRCGRAKDRVSDMLLNTGKNPGNACIYRKNCV